jgi:hypothetical protein
MDVTIKVMLEKQMPNGLIIAGYVDLEYPWTCVEVDNEYPDPGVRAFINSENLQGQYELLDYDNHRIGLITLNGFNRLSVNIKLDLTPEGEYFKDVHSRSTVELLLHLKECHIDNDGSTYPNCKGKLSQINVLKQIRKYIDLHKKRQIEIENPQKQSVEYFKHISGQ